MMHRIALCLLLALPATALAQGQAVGPNNPQAQAPVPTADPAAVRAAREGLARYVKLVKESNYRRLGFESLAEVRVAKLGLPFDDMFIPLDRLRAYAPGTDLKGLVQKGVRVVFPVEVSAVVRSSITVARTPNGWKAVAFGAPSFIQKFSQARLEAAASSNLPAARYFIVRVPALSLQVLGLADPNDADGLSFVLVLPDPRLDVPVGRPVPARSVVEQLAPRARALQDDAPG